MEENTVCLIDGANGIYVPQLFARQFADHWKGLEGMEEQLALLNMGVVDEQYWEAWDDVYFAAWFQDPDGNVWRLFQDGDLFAYECVDSESGEQFV